MAGEVIPTIIDTPDINRGTSNVALPAEVSAEIWGATLDESAIMQLARRITLPGPGITVQTITGEPSAAWVDETDPKPVSAHTFGKKTITPYKLAVIEPFSMEFMRDKAALYNECVNRLPKAIAKKFDGTIMGTVAPGSGFDVLGSCTAVSLVPGAGKTVYDQFVAADAAIAAADGIMDGIALAPQGKSIVLGATDAQDRPLFTAGPESNTVGSILGAKVLVNKGVYVPALGAAPTVGIAGDWSDAVYGIVEGIKLDISKDATLVTDDGIIALWQQNMVAVRVEVEIGFAVKSASEFVLLKGDAAGGSTGQS